jgi:hypothetical protein
MLSCVITVIAIVLIVVHTVPVPLTAQSTLHPDEYIIEVRHVMRLVIAIVGEAIRAPHLAMALFPDSTGIHHDIFRYARVVMVHGFTLLPRLE